MKVFNTAVETVSEKLYTDQRKYLPEESTNHHHVANDVTFIQKQNSKKYSGNTMLTK